MVKYVKPVKEKLLKIYLQVITDVCVKIAVLEIYFEILICRLQWEFTADIFAK